MELPPGRPQNCRGGTPLLVATTFRASILVVMVGALAVGGCSSPVGPGGTLVRDDRPRPYYPLTLGNHWVYNARGVLNFDSSGVWTVRDQHFSVEVELRDSVRSLDRTYLIERSRNQFAGL